MQRLTAILVSSVLGLIPGMNLKFEVQQLPKNCEAMFGIITFKHIKIIQVIKINPLTQESTSLL